MKYRYLTILLKLVLLLCWPPTAFAAVTILATLEEQGWAVFGVLLFISTLTGLTALAIRLDKELRETGKALQHPWIFVCSHMLASWTGAMLAFFLAESLGMNDWTELMLVLAFSFGGVKALEKVVENLIDKYIPPKVGT